MDLLHQDTPTACQLAREPPCVGGQIHLGGHVEGPAEGSSVTSLPLSSMESNPEQLENYKLLKERKLAVTAREQ